jgi:hypothetical protein
MSTTIENHFVKPLVEFYGRSPFGSGFAKRLEPYAKTLNAEVLDTIATRLIEEGGKSFPTLPKCVAALKRAEEYMAAPQDTTQRPWEHDDKAEWRAKQDAIRLCRCSMGEMADSEGWLAALMDFCRERGRLPNSHEIASVKGTARQSERALEMCRGTGLYESAKTWRQNMMARAHTEVFGADQ